SAALRLGLFKGGTINGELDRFAFGVLATELEPSARSAGQDGDRSLTLVLSSRPGLDSVIPCLALQLERELVRSAVLRAQQPQVQLLYRSLIRAPILHGPEGGGRTSHGRIRSMTAGPAAADLDGLS